MTIRIVEFSGENPELVDGLCLHPNDPPKMLRVMSPYMEVRKDWLRRMAKKGLHLAVAITDDGEKAGLVEAIPVEWAAEAVRGEGTLFANCLWVLPRHWKSGVGRALVEWAVGRASANGYGGISVLAYERDRWFGHFSYMPAGFFKRFGFTEVGRDESRVLLHLDLGGSRVPSLMRPRERPGVRSTGGRPVIEVLVSSQCPWSAWMTDGIARNLKKFDVDSGGK